VPAGFEARRSRLGSLVLDDVGAAAARQALSTDKEIAS
jgi:N-methylhydantoinase A